MDTVIVTCMGCGIRYFIEYPHQCPSVEKKEKSLFEQIFGFEVF